MRVSLLLVLVAAAACAGDVTAAAAPGPRVAAEITLPEAFAGEYATLVWDSANAQSCDLELPAGWTTVGVDRDTSGALQVGPITEDARPAVVCDGVRVETPVKVVPRKRLRLDGVFDIGCNYSHTLPDDPIRFHGDPGASHLHDFVGNKTTDAYSTFDTLMGALLADRHATTCSEIQRKSEDHPARNASAYWEPVVFRNGQPVHVHHLHLYYFSMNDRMTRPFPPGFSMIASEGHTKFWCQSPGHFARDRLPGACQHHRYFHMEVRFPNCWNGQLADDGVSHVAYELRQGGCPWNFPFEIPRLLAEWYIGDPDNPIDVKDDWTLSSGPLSTAHADEMNAWDPFRLDFLVHQCSNLEDKCKGDPPPGFDDPVHQVKA